MTAVKICGLKDTENLGAAISSGASYIGLVFFAKSPRNIDFHTAANLRQLVPANVKAVGLFVNPTDEELEKFALGLKLDLIQLHGDETPERVAEIQKKFERPVMKAVNIANAKDVQQIDMYQKVADWILVDSRPQGAKLPGGTGKAFDWDLLRAQKFTKPWMLSGGLRADNVKTALQILKPDVIDVSSGVEITRGQSRAVRKIPPKSGNSSPQ
jgi:phosphoribosylanthranilate isomerase